MASFLASSSLALDTHAFVRRQQQGSAQGQGDSSLSGFLCTLIPVALICGLYLVLFLVFRTKFRRIYEPRTYLGKFSEHQRAPSTSQSLLGWVKDFWKTPDEYILNSQSIDGYLYLRFYKVIFTICLGGCCVCLPVLLAVYGSGASGLKNFNLLAISNIAAQPNRYYAPVFVSWVFFSFVMFMIARETMFFIKLRSAYILSPLNQSRMSARTVLFTDVPKEYLDQGKLREIYSDVQHIWIATDTKDLEDLDEDRQKTAIKLEGAECKLLKAANTQRLKLAKKGKTLENPIAWADEKKRPTHRLKPIIGHKVDTIDWCRNHLKDLIGKCEADQEKHMQGHAATIPAVFIEFTTVQAAHSAYQDMYINKPKGMTPRTVGTVPSEIIWSNLSVKKPRRKILYALFTALVVLLIFFWTPLTVFAGVISNIFNLARTIKWLNWLLKVPSVIQGLITGLLPAYIIVILMALVPIILKMFAKLAGVVSTGEQQLMVQGWYYWFQFFIVFLITTFSSGAAAAGAQIANDPSSAPVLLAQQIPTANNFYISYFVLTGLSTFGSTLANIVALAIYLILGTFLDKTPRKKYDRYIKISGISWGSAYPKYTCIATIALIYSMIAPLVLLFATIGLALFYIAFRYQLFYALDTNQMTTGGETYRKALQQLTTGVYVGELCLIGIFAMNTGSNPQAAGPLALELVALVFTIIFHVGMNMAFKPLLDGLSPELLGTNANEAAVNIEMGNVDNGMQGEEVPRQSSVGRDDRTLLNHEQRTNYKLGISTENANIRQPKPTKKWQNTFFKLLHAPTPPRLADYYETALDPYTEDTRDEAFVNPAISSVTPVIWFPHDDFGGSAREKEATGAVTLTSDDGAYWDAKKGKLTVLGIDEKEEWETLRSTPLFDEKKPMY